MKTIVLLTRRNVGMYCLSYLVAKGYKVKLITDDNDVLWLGGRLGVEFVTLETMGDLDYMLSVHWHKIIPNEFLKEGRSINIHPCLFKYKGTNPIKRYISNGDTLGSVESHYMIEEVDAGEVIHREMFQTPKIESYAEFYNLALPYYFKCLAYTLEIFEKCE
jgi:methionyl-tRNA formyltransferase